MSKRIMVITTVFTIGMYTSMGLAFPVQQSGSTTKQDTTRQDTTSRTDSTGNNNARLDSSDRRFIMDAAHGGMMEVHLGQMAVERASSAEVKQFAQRMIDDHTKSGSELMELASSKGVTLPAMHSASHATGAGSHTMDTGSQATGTGSQMKTGSQATGSGSQTGTGSGSDRTGTGSQTTSSQSSGSGSQMGKGSHAGMMDPKHKAASDKLSKLSGAEFDREYMRMMVKDHGKMAEMFEREATKGKDADVKAWAAKTLPTVREHLQMARDLSAKTDTNAGKGNSSSNKQP